MVFGLTQGHYRLEIQMTGMSHTDTFSIAVLLDDGGDGGYTGNPVTEFISSQTDHDTLTNLANGLIAAQLNNNPTRWTSGSVIGVYKTPTAVQSV